MANKNTLKGAVLSVCNTPQNANLLVAAYEALTWVAVGSVGNLGEFGSSSNIVSYNTLDESVTNKQKGIADAGEMTVECASIYSDAGQIILRSFGVATNQDNMAFKLEYADGPAGYTNTIIFSRGVVSGPVFPGGGGDDFIKEQYTIGLNQVPIRVDPETV